MTDGDWVIGIDGGGTHTVTLLANRAGQVLGRAIAGPSNIQSVGLVAGLAALDESITEAFATAELPVQRVRAATLGLAGVGSHEGQALLHEWADRRGLAERVEVVNDAVIVLVAGTPNAWGVAVIAGTGAIAVGRRPGGPLEQAGGWGWLLGDEGSAYALATSALRAVCQSADGLRPPTALTEVLLRRIGSPTTVGLIPLIYRGNWDRAALAGLAPLVLATADHGDALARQIRAEAATDLARTAATVVRKLQEPAARVPLALTGGMLLGSPGYRAAFLTALDQLGIVPASVTPVAEPAEGAVRMACALATGQSLA
jgi:N-acetylglucosamine kinase-like BadF-type ATPase